MANCAPCVHAREHGWWGDTIEQGATHCRECHRTFRGHQFHCVRCHETFGGIAATDMHQPSNGDVQPCKDPAAIGLLVAKATHLGIVWSQGRSGPQQMLDGEADSAA